MKLRGKEEEEGGQERNGSLILSNDMLAPHANLCINKNLVILTPSCICKDNLLLRKHYPRRLID